MDEFCATLDRETTKIVAYNVQKLARKLGKAVVAATTHVDLLEDLAPSVHIHKRFGCEVTVEYQPNVARQSCSLLDEMTVEEGSYSELKEVAGFHYRSHRIAFLLKVFVLKRKKRVCGAVVYTSPMSAAPCRGSVRAQNQNVLKSSCDIISCPLALRRKMGCPKMSKQDVKVVDAKFRSKKATC